ncbi:arylsulfatase [soil metagenome]
MKTGLAHSLTLAAALGSLHPATAKTDTPAKPNIIVVLADDMGWSDIGCYGGEIPTPNLDALAKNGLRFTEFYNLGRCCPSRASLLTGLYPHQTGVGRMLANNHLPGYEGKLNDTCVTLAEVLQPAGYFTAMTGKWHLGQDQGVVPWRRGFERTLTAPTGGFYSSADPKADLYLNGEKIANDDPRLPKNWYTTDLWTQYGIKFIDEALAAKKPFFLYLAYNAPHFPLEAPPEDIAKFRHSYLPGWDKLREARFKRQQKMGLIDPKWELSPRPDDIKAWDSITDEQKDRFDQIMSIYAASVWHMDKDIGELVAALRKRGVLDNTLILFMSDNGGNAESGPKGKLNGDNPGGPGSVVFCGESWANLQDTPNRLFKHFNHEGGISTPLIVHWPAGIAAKGELRTEPSHFIDIISTLVDYAGATYPKQFNGQAVQPMEGKSLRPAFADQPISRDEPLFWSHEGNAAIRVGDWKLVRQALENWELYDLKADRTEVHDLASAQPDRVQQMTALWDAWAKRTHVEPRPGRGQHKTPAPDNED